MEVTFVNPGVNYMIEQIMGFQFEDGSAFWTEPLYHFYPQPDNAYAATHQKVREQTEKDRNCGDGVTVFDNFFYIYA